MELNTSTLNDFVKNAKVMFLKGLDSVSAVMRNSGLFKVVSIEQNSGNSWEFSEIDLEEYASKKGESDQAARAKVQQGYTKTVSPFRIAKDIGISYEMRTQNKYPEIVSRLTNLGALASNRIDLDLAHRISFGADTSYTNLDGDTVDTTVGDGFQLFYSAHTLAGSSTTYRNILANNPQLSKGALESMEKLIVEETYNHLGEKKAMSFDILWTTDDPNTVNTAKELLKSTASVTSNNSGVDNVYKAKYRHVVLPRVATDATGAPDSTKAKYWGLASSMNTSAYLGVLEEPRLKTPALGSNAEEFSTDDLNFGVRAGYYVTVVGANWIKASKGDGSA